MQHFTIISGDSSSDTYAADMAQYIKKHYPECHIHGIGGPKLHAIAPNVLPHDILCVVGLVEIIKNIFPILSLRRKLLQQLNNLETHIVILIDCPGFNMSLLRAITTKHHIIYAIPPQIWAWHESRIQKLRRYCAELWVLYPFEEKFYHKHHQPVHVLRHPLVHKKHLALRPLSQQAPIKVALLPGSRVNERQTLMPYFIKLTQDIPDITWVWVESKPGFLTHHYTDLRGVVVLGLENLPNVHAAIAASGTVTLELGLMGVPMLIVYKVHAFTAWCARKLIRIPWIGLPNILLQDNISPELIQESLTDANLQSALAKLLHDPSPQYRRLSTIRQFLRHDAPSMVENLQRIIDKIYPKN